MCISKKTKMNTAIDLTGSQDGKQMERDIVAKVNEMTRQRFNGNVEAILDSEYWQFGDEIEVNYNELSPPFKPRSDIIRRYASIAYEGTHASWRHRTCLRTSMGSIMSSSTQQCAVARALSTSQGSIIFSSNRR